MSAYTVHVVKGTGIWLTGDFTRPTISAQVWHEDGKVAWKTASYEDQGGRFNNGLRLQASNACKRFNAYFERTGKRWEIEEEERLAKERAEKKRTQRIAYLKKTIPEYTAELAALLATEGEKA
jgi:hypothetical protein